MIRRPPRSKHTDTLLPDTTHVRSGHVEYMKYMVDMLREHGAGHIRVVGGGGGTITPEEIRELEAYGVERIYHPNDSMKLGLVEMIEDVRSEEHTSELQSLMRISYAVFCLTHNNHITHQLTTA